jgi:hypothetical protein
MEYMEGPPVWTAVKYGSRESLKNAIEMSTLSEALLPGGRDLTSPLHEAIIRCDIDIVNMLRRNRVVDMQYKPLFGDWRGMTPCELSRRLCTWSRGSISSEINRIMAQELLHAETYDKQRAEVARMANLRRLALENKQKCLAFAMGHHRRLGHDSRVGNLEHGVADMIMKQLAELQEAERLHQQQQHEQQQQQEQQQHGM